MSITPLEDPAPDDDGTVAVVLLGALAAAIVSLATRALRSHCAAAPQRRKFHVF